MHFMEYSLAFVAISVVILLTQLPIEATHLQFRIFRLVICFNFFDDLSVREFVAYIKNLH